jgi:hypothetical protein
LAVQVAIDDACRYPPDVADMFAKRLEARFLRQILGNGNNRDENDSRDQARNAEGEWIYAPSGKHRAIRGIPC